MSSWKKASKVNQKIHRERHQPDSRAHLGLLEKKKDYKLRADDFNRKKRILKKLQIKALNRNPDEFYFHMINSKVVDGKHKELKKKNPQHSVEQAKLLEGRKQAYISMKRTEEIKQLSKLQSSLHMVDIASKMQSSHVYFNDEDDKRTKKSESDEEDPESTDLAAYPNGIPNLDVRTVRKMNKYKNKKYSELLKRINREKQLGIVQRNMELLHALKDKSGPRPKLIKEGSKNEAPVYLWKYQRKR
ncbi:hypothetical protein AAG570_008548 [Ranatra chinensis]|uniref:U3 small nucleolar RNA-associated protein 11 n=1 Tax=Ranatra chinensis TaxID=642074 RepID=A0ABD0YR86_9HEMI